MLYSNGQRRIWIIRKESEVQIMAIWNLIKAFIIGALSYTLAGLWINWGNYPPTQNTPGAYYGLNVVFLVFWVVSFVIFQKNK